jgi:hypothetical protein
MAYIKDDKERKAKTIEILERVGLELSILIDIQNFPEDKDNNWNS